MTTQPTQIRQYAKQCLEDEAQALLELIPQLDENFDKAVNMIYNCKGKIIVTGVGKSGHIGAKIAATLSSTGTPARTSSEGASPAFSSDVTMAIAGHLLTLSGIAAA